jgi:hypothetical protein
MRRGFGFAELERQVVQVAVKPVLAWLKGPDDRMTDSAEVLRCMPVLRAVAAPDVSTGLTHSQVHPHVARLQAFLATVAARIDVQDLIEVRALSCHYTRPFHDHCGTGNPAGTCASFGAYPITSSTAHSI